MFNGKRIKKMIQKKKIKNKKRIFLQIFLIKKLKNQDLENKKIKNTIIIKKQENIDSLKKIQLLKP